MEKITIVISSFNQEKYIPDLIESLKNQTFQNFKVLIIDSYSTDNTVNIFKNYDKAEIINLKCSAEAGYLHGINLVKSKYLMVMTTSDYYYSNSWLQTAYDTLEENKDLSLVWCNAISVNDKRKFKGIWRPELFLTDSPKKFEYFYYWFCDNYLPELNYCVNTKVYQYCIKDFEKIKVKINISFMWLFLFNFTKYGFLQKYIKHLGHVGRNHDNSQGEKNESNTTHEKWDISYRKLQLKYFKDLILKKEIHNFRNSKFEIIKTLSNMDIFLFPFKIVLMKFRQFKFYVIRIFLFKIYIKKLIYFNKFFNV